ncbi:ATP-binding protein [candidate division WOR-3 bacterium]|nr:ATP-binding protein [candidate division WOR-3 bacterium]
MQSKKVAPFKAGGVVEPPFFVGREQELRTLVKNAQNLTQNSVIIGPRRYGKSSLLHNIKIRIEANSDIIVPMINCREMSNLNDFCDITIGTILKSYEKRHRLKGLFSSFHRVLHDKILNGFKAVSEIGGSVERIGEFYLKFREKEIPEEELVRQTFEFIHNFIEEKNLQMVIVYDEFQKTDTFNGFLYELFKSSMDRENKVKYFFSGSSLSLLKRVFLRENSPLYLMTSKHFMRPLIDEIVTKFVIHRFETQRLSIEEKSDLLFHELTGGIPFYIQKLGLLCWEQTLIEEKTKITSSLVLNAFKKMLEELDGEFEARIISRFSDQQRKIIKSFSQSKSLRMVEIAKAMDCKTSDISSAMSRLVNAMVLGKDKEGNYYLIDEVFRRWLSSQI